MIYYELPMQLASVLPLPCAHHESYKEITVTKPGEQAHIIVLSQD